MHIAPENYLHAYVPSLVVQLYTCRSYIIPRQPRNATKKIYRKTEVNISLTLSLVLVCALHRWRATENEH